MNAPELSSVPPTRLVQSRLLVVQQADDDAVDRMSWLSPCESRLDSRTAIRIPNRNAPAIPKALFMCVLVIISMLFPIILVDATRYPIKINQGTKRVSSSSSASSSSRASSSSSRTNRVEADDTSTLVIQSTEFVEEAKSLPLSFRNQSPLGYSSSFAITPFYPQQEYLELPYYMRPPVPFHAPPPPPSRAMLIDRLGLASYRGNGTIGMTLAQLMAKSEPVDEEAWAELKGKCAQVVSSKYLYKLCPFGNITQSYLAPRSKRSDIAQPLIASDAPVFHLGSFSGWAYHSEREELAMHYTNGNVCTARDGTHRRRQTKIYLRCLKHRPASELAATTALGRSGSGNSTTDAARQSDLLAPDEFFLRHVLEGERCRYSARMYTPLICGVGYKTSKKLKRLVREKRVKQARVAHEKLVKRISNPATRTALPTSSSSNNTVDYTLLLRGNHGGGSVHQRLQFHLAFSEMKQCLGSIMKQMSLQQSSVVAVVRDSSNDGASETPSRSHSNKFLRKQRLRSGQAFQAITAQAFQPTVDKLCRQHLDQTNAKATSALP